MPDGMTGLHRIAKVQELNTRDPHWVNRDVYRLVFNEDVLIAAYESIKSKPGNMTPGATGDTLDGTSLEVIRNIAYALRDESFSFTPARRVEIPKSNGKTRPLGIAEPKEKIVQKAMEMVLSAIYDPTFSPHSHGFRANKGCHSCLQEIRNTWAGSRWFIEGDIKGFFDNIDHQVLTEILRERIADERFVGLVWKALRAGILVYPEGATGSTPLLRTFLKRGTLCQRSVHVQTQKI